MRICYLSKNQQMTQSNPSKSLKGFSKCHQIFMVLNSDTLKKPCRAIHRLNHRQITQTPDSLPLQAHTKLFHNPRLGSSRC